MKAIRSMSERKLVIYFAQGDGELALNSGRAWHGGGTAWTS